MSRRKKEGIGVAGLIGITILQIGNEAKTISMPKDTCVAELLEELGLSEGTEVRNGEAILSSDDILEDNDQIMIMSAGKIEGGNDEEESEDEDEKDEKDEETDKDEDEETDEDEDEETDGVGEDEEDDEKV